MKYIVYLSRVLFFVIVAAPFYIYAYPYGQDAIVGVWLTEKRDSKVEIVSEGDNLFGGKLIWVEAPNEEFTGTEILKGVTFDAASGRYICPWVYDPKLGITVRATARVSNDTLYLKAKKGLIIKNEIFTRVK